MNQRRSPGRFVLPIAGVLTTLCALPVSGGPRPPPKEAYLGVIQRTAGMTRMEGFPVVRSGQLEADEGYKLELQVRLEEFRLPFHLHRVLTFVSFWDAQTPWYIQPVPGHLRKGP